MDRPSSSSEQDPNRTNRTFSIEMVEPSAPPQSHVNVGSTMEMIEPRFGGTLTHLDKTSRDRAKRPVNIDIPAHPEELNHSQIDLLFDTNKPDYSQMKKKIDETHARNKFGRPYSCFEVCCDFNVGTHKGYRTTTESDMDKFGAGMVLYFRFVKYLAMFFLLFALLAAPALFHAIMANQDVSVKGLLDYKGILYLTTLGSQMRGVTECSRGRIAESVTFTCERGTLGPLSTLQYGRILEDQNLPCDYLTMYSWNRQCNNMDTQSIAQAYQSCEGLQTCTFTIDSSFFDLSQPECNSGNAFYFKAYCENTETTLPKDAKISKRTTSFILASLDALICILFIIMLLLLRKMQKDTVNHLAGNVNSVERYTIKVGNLPRINRVVLKRELWKHFSEVIQHEKVHNFTVVDVQLAESQYLLDIQVRLQNLGKKRTLLSKKFYNKWCGSMKNKDTVSYEDIKQLASTGSDKMVLDFHEIKKIKDQQDKLNRKLRHDKIHKTSEAATAFVTFETKAMRDDAFKTHQKSPFKRFFYSLCTCFYKKSDTNIFYGNYLKVKSAPPTSNILWPNVGVSKTERFFRRLVSWAITIFFWAISFGLILIAKAQQENSFDTVKPTLNCDGYDNLTLGEVEADSALGNEAIGLVECYCRSDFQKQLFTGVCRDWETKVILNKALPFLVVGGIIITNYALQYLFKFLSSFERHQSLTSESSSRVIKIFVAQVLNTGLIILFVNARFTRYRVQNVLEGHYDDLTSEWYLNVGTTVLMTMIINIVNLPIVNYFFYALRGLARCFDRGCTFNKEKTSKDNQEEYVKLYTGPEFLIDFRYAQILTVVFICFLYSPGMPLLYVTTFLSLLLIYWMDKIFLLKICKLPRMLDDQLENIVRHALFLAVFIHLVFAVWTYGNPEIFDNQESYLKNIELITAAQEKTKTYIISSVKERAIEEQNLALTILFGILVGAAAVAILFRNTVSRLRDFCRKRNVSRVFDMNSAAFQSTSQKTYFDYIHLEDLEREVKYLQKELNETTDNGLRERLQQRLERVKHELSKRNPAEENNQTKFIGPFSYFIGHHDTYKGLFNIKHIQLNLNASHAPLVASDLS